MLAVRVQRMATFTASSGRGGFGQAEGIVEARKDIESLLHFVAHSKLPKGARRGSLTPKRKLMWGLGVALGFFLAIEVGARLGGVAKCGPVLPDPGNWEEMLGDRKRLWKMRPDYIIPSPVGPPTRINSVGLRDSLLPEEAGGPPKGDNEIIWVLTVGDSSVYGWVYPPAERFKSCWRNNSQTTIHCALLRSSMRVFRAIPASRLFAFWKRWAGAISRMFW